MKWQMWAIVKENEKGQGVRSYKAIFSAAKATLSGDRASSFVPLFNVIV
jgi:hypothetical protein